MLGVPEGRNGESRKRKKYLLIEIGVILLLLWMPPVWYGLLTSLQPAPRFNWDAVGTTISSLGRIGIIVFVIWLSGERLTRFGCNRFRATHLGWFLAALVGMVIFGVCFAGIGIQTSGAFIPSGSLWMHDYGGLRVPYLAVALPLSAAGEELLMRAYLITRLVDLWGSKWLALILSSLMFGMWHPVGGWIHVASSTVLGIVSGLVLLRTNSIWPSIAAHTVFNVLVRIGAIAWLSYGFARFLAG